jgi:hypothetical protein
MFHWKTKITFQFLLIVVFILLLSACDGRPKGVLASGKMADVLVEMHKTDAVLAEKGYVFGRYSNKAPYYKFILKKYNITQAQFDSSLVWYTKNPQRFENVYDNVLSQLTSLQKDVDSRKFHPIDYEELGKQRTDLWNQGRKYTFNKDSVRTKFAFEIKNEYLLYRDVYVLKMLLNIAREDSCKNRRIELRINYFNGQSDSKSVIAYNDGITRRYVFRMPAYKKLKIKSISGQLLGCSAFKGIFHATLDSLSLIREYKPIQMDSLRGIVQKADTTHYKGALKFEIPTKTKPSTSKIKILKPL